MGSIRVCNSVEGNSKVHNSSRKHAHRLTGQDVPCARASSLIAVRDRYPSTKKAQPQAHAFTSSNLALFAK